MKLEQFINKYSEDIDNCIADYEVNEEANDDEIQEKQSTNKKKQKKDEK